MKARLWLKGLIASIVVALMLFGTGVLCVGVAGLLVLDRSQTLGQSQLDAIDASMQNVRSSEIQSAEHFASNTAKDLALKKILLQRFADDDEYTGPSSIDEGAVVKLDGDSVSFLTDAPEAVTNLTADQIRMILESEPASVSIDTVKGSYKLTDLLVVSGIQISDNLIYLSWSTMDEYAGYLDETVTETETLQTFEETCDSAILVISMDGEDLGIVYQSSVFPEAHTAADLGFTRAMIEKHESDITIDGVSYYCLYRENEVTNTVTVYLVSEGSESIRSGMRALFVALVMGIVLVTLGSYVLMCQAYARDKQMQRDLKKLFSPTQVKRNALVAGGLSVVLIFTSSALIQAIGVLREQLISGEKTVNLLVDGLEARDSDRKRNSAEEEALWIVYYGSCIADVLSDHPEMANKAMLSQLNDVIGTNYLMMFDSSGNEVACSKDYAGFSLGMGQGENSEDFKRLLYGIPSIIHEESADEATGTVQQFIGVTIPAEEGEMHGALIMAAPAELINNNEYTVDINKMLSMVTPQDELLLAVDKETGIVLYSSNESYQNDLITDIGFTEVSLQDGYMDFDWIQGKHFFVKTTEHNGTVYYYAADQADIFESVPLFAAFAAFCYVIICTVMLAILLRGYDQALFDEWSQLGEAVVDEGQVEVVSRDKRIRRTTDPSGKRRSGFTSWSDMLPFYKARMIFVVLLAVLVFIVYRLVKDTGDGLGGGSLTQYILQGDWMRGFNLFALCAILIVCAMATVLIIFTKEVFQVLARVLDDRSETVLRLIYSLLRYGIVLCAVYFVFGYLGFDARTRLASLGIVSLALSFGAQALVADVISGISIVFEGSFKVGDIVEIEGFRGTVQEIGVRTTKLLGRGDNIKIINNNVIKNVLNLSRLNSWYPLEIKVSANESLEKIEGVMRRGLPEIAKRYEDVIIGGPYYKGVLLILAGNMTLSVLAECREEDYYKVGRILNGEVQSLLRNAGIEIK